MNPVGTDFAVAGFPVEFAHFSGGFGQLAVALPGINGQPFAFAVGVVGAGGAAECEEEGGQCGTGFHAVGRVVVVGRYDRGLCGKRLLLRVSRIAVDEGVPFLVVGFFGLALPPIGDGVAAGGRQFPGLAGNGAQRGH